LHTAPLSSATGLDPSWCPVEVTLGVIGGKWKALIVYNLRQGPARFNVLRRLIPDVTQRMLTQHLRELEADGLISRTVHAVVPPHVEYALTTLGHTLTPVLDAMAAWGFANAHLRTPRAEAA
jgi:DNA-binding HxlR family transcriptional regulator